MGASSSWPDAFPRDIQDSRGDGLVFLPYHTFVNRARIYGVPDWGHFFASRRALALSIFAKKVREAQKLILSETGDAAFASVMSAAPSWANAPDPADSLAVSDSYAVVRSPLPFQSAIGYVPFSPIGHTSTKPVSGIFFVRLCSSFRCSA